MIPVAATLAQQNDASTAGHVLITNSWPHTKLTLVSAGTAKPWRVVIDHLDTTQRTEFDLSRAITVPSNTYMLRNGRILIQADEGPGGHGAELAIVDPDAGRELEHLFVKSPSVSPDGRYVFCERQNRKPEDDHVGSVLLLYDVMKTPAANRTASSEPIVDIGIPV